MPMYHTMGLRTLVSMVLIGGIGSFALRGDAPVARHVLAVIFGIGCGLVLDEFALVLHLEDVYWSDEGRQSVDAVVIAMTLGAMVVLGLAPLDVGDTGSIVSITVAVAIQVFIGGLLVHVPHGFDVFHFGDPMARGYEYSLALIGALLCVTFAGPGNWALQRAAPAVPAPGTAFRG